jgi:adenylate cyclase
MYWKGAFNAGNRVRVMAQLVDARTDAHLWAQTYDRDLADVFAIQSEIAKTIADQLQARLSPAEKAAIEQRPTADLAAFDLYVRATALADAYHIGKENLLQAVNLFGQAIGRIPARLLQVGWRTRPSLPPRTRPHPWPSHLGGRGS